MKISNTTKKSYIKYSRQGAKTEDTGTLHACIQEKSIAKTYTGCDSRQHGRHLVGRGLQEAGEVLVQSAQLRFAARAKDAEAAPQLDQLSAQLELELKERAATEEEGGEYKVTGK